MSGLILPIDKPAGWTSFDVVAKLRGALKWKKVGHAGTLDPMATGLLIVLFGECTSASDEFMELGKSYRGVIRLGTTTTTDDLDGEVVSTSAVEWNEQRISDAVSAQSGEILQRPPAVSAVKVEGQRSYKRARRGESVIHAERTVMVTGIRVIEMKAPDIAIEVACSKGTYIRSIARDVGCALGCGGTLAELKRTRIGPYDVADAWPLHEALRRPEFMSRQ